MSLATAILWNLSGFATRSISSNTQAADAIERQPETTVAERREGQRFPVALRLCLIPLDDEFNAAGPPRLVRGRDISADGLSFHHRLPLSVRYAAISYETATGHETVVAKLSWCRFARPGEYISGGKLVRYSFEACFPQNWDNVEVG